LKLSPFPLFLNGRRQKLFSFFRPTKKNQNKTKSNQCLQTIYFRRPMSFDGMSCMPKKKNSRGRRRIVRLVFVAHWGYSRAADPKRRRHHQSIDTKIRLLRLLWSIAGWIPLSSLPSRRRLTLFSYKSTASSDKWNLKGKKRKLESIMDQ
jgi:hypothetical protein